MHWRSERNEYGGIIRPKVQMYECQFTTTQPCTNVGKPRTANMTVLVVCDTVEDAISLCRKQWPVDFVLHQVVRRNQRCDLIVDNSVLRLAEPTVKVN